MSKSLNYCCFPSNESEKSNRQKLSTESGYFIDSPLLQPPEPAVVEDSNDILKEQHTLQTKSSRNIIYKSLQEVNMKLKEETTSSTNYTKTLVDTTEQKRDTQKPIQTLEKKEKEEEEEKETMLITCDENDKKSDGKSKVKNNKKKDETTRLNQERWIEEINNVFSNDLQQNQTFESVIEESIMIETSEIQKEEKEKGKT